MAFIQKEPTSFISVKLTNIGRKKLALGSLNFAKAVVSDREINYAFNRRYPNTSYFSTLQPNVNDYWDFCSNRILEPVDKHPALPLNNYNGTPPYGLDGKIFVSKSIITAQTQSTGFWSATTSNGNVEDYILHPDRYLLSGSVLTSELNGSTQFEIVGTSLPAPGSLLLMRNYAPVNNSPNEYSSSAFIDLFYRVIDTGDTPNTIQVDRPLPNFDDGSEEIYWYSYPFQGISSWYGSGTSQNTPVWNLNITRTSREIGMKDAAVGANSGQSYTTFGSVEYNGAKQFFGFENDVRQVGFIHYTNEYTGNTYAEQLLPGSTTLDLPSILWHRKESNPGSGATGGHRFTDEGSNVFYDQIAQTSYTLLKDDVGTNALAVGRVYYKLKIIVITDPELLTAMSYKSGRNWTLPPLVVGTQSVPNSPLTIESASGLCRSDYNYYVTYHFVNNGPYDSTSNLGYQQSFPCGYIRKVEGFTDMDGNSQFLSCTFPNKSFPYLRNQAQFTSFSGTGWSANKFQILVQEVHKDEDPGIDGLHPGRWSGASDIDSYGNGVYSGLTTHNTIDPTFLQAHQFIISLEDIISGDTKYDASETSQTYRITTGFTNTDYINSNGLTLGNEDFLFGNITTKIVATSFKTVFTIEIKDNELNASNSGGFDGEKDENAYITEIGILSSDGEVVAVGKPTFPIKKNSSRYLTFQLELDF